MNGCAHDSSATRVQPDESRIAYTSGTWDTWVVPSSPWCKSRRHSTGDASPMPALLLHRILPDILSRRALSSGCLNGLDAAPGLAPRAARLRTRRREMGRVSCAAAVIRRIANWHRSCSIERQRRSVATLEGRQTPYPLDGDRSMRPRSSCTDTLGYVVERYGCEVTAMGSPLPPSG